MTRVFKVEKSHADIVSKGTLFKVLKYLDKNSKVETPVLLLDRSRVKENVSAIGSNIGNSAVFYAVKANPHVETLKLMDGLGTGFEIASDGELRILASIGVAPERIITSNPVKSEKFIKAAVSYGVRYFAYDSPVEVEKLARLAPGANVYVRLTVPNEGSEWPLSRKFGVEPDGGLALLLQAKEKGLNPVGLTFHVGSQCLNPYNWNTAILKAKALWDMAEKKGIRLSVLNVGGGYPIKYTKSVVGIETIEKNVDRLIKENFPPSTRVFIEPGRAMVGDAGVFVSTVIGRAKRALEDWVYIDVGVFNGLMESVGGIRYSYIVENGQPRKKKFTITGPSCDSFDVIDKEVQLPEPEIGSLMLILSCGAYTVSYASEFNGFSIPETVLI